MQRFLLSTLLFVSLFLAANQVLALQNWKWVENENGNFYTRVTHLDCETGVTVFYKDDHRGTGWRIAFDDKVFINRNNDDYETTMVDAIELFYGDYTHSFRYQLVCPCALAPCN
jgi:hypothetical protein